MSTAPRMSGSRIPAEAYLALSLGWEDSEFTPVMGELYLLCWLARGVDGYQQTTSPGAAVTLTSSRSRYRLGQACAGWVPTGTRSWPGTTAWPGIRRSPEPCDCG